MRAGDGYWASNISANTAAFVLRGGLYGVDVVATGTGTVTLEKLAGDGTTYVTALAAFSTNGAYATVYLPPGTYKLAVATFTAVYAQVQRIPGD